MKEQIFEELETMTEEQIELLLSMIREYVILHAL